jgi:hypothetical protein
MGVSMPQKKYLKMVLIIVLLLLSLGGFLLHSRAHPFTDNPANFIPFFTGLISIVVITALFCFKKLVPFAYLANGILAIIGTITMAHFSLSKLPESFTLIDILLKTTLADILILWGAFFTGKLIFDLELTNVNNLDAPRHKGRFIRYPNLGYWFIHLAVLGIVYYLGHTFWK